MFKDAFHIMFILPMALLVFLVLFAKFWWVVALIALVGILYYKRNKDEYKEKMERLASLKEKIFVSSQNSSDEYVILREISVKNNDENCALLEAFEAAEAVGAEAILDFRVNNQVYTSVYTQDHIGHEILTGRGYKTVESTNHNEFTITGIAIKYKYDRQTRDYLRFEDEAVKEISKLDLLKQNGMINDEDYIDRKNKIRDKLVTQQRPSMTLQ